MTHASLLPAFATGLTVIATLASASPTDTGSGGWYDAPIDAAVQVTPMTEADVFRLANLDDDPSVITDEEREMMVVLRQVLGLPPVAD